MHGTVVKPALFVQGMLGMGDCLHQRAVLRELMRDHDVTLLSYYAAMFHDLVAAGLKLTFPVKSSKAPRIEERASVPVLSVPRGVSWRRVTYNPRDIAAGRHASLLAAMFDSVRLIAPAQADFSLPVPQAWRAEARALIASWPTGGRPVMVYRPIVLSKTWEAPARSPDPEAYAALFASIRDRFFVVSLANLDDNEWIVGGEQDADVKLHHGELPFETLAGLFAEAALAFVNPGFSPVLAQAVGTPGIIVYGGNESFRTTNSAGAHLAPTLAIEPDRPCECHSRMHGCDKRITMGPALDKVRAFAERGGQIARRVDAEAAPARPRPPRILIFGTTYVDTPERRTLVEQWVALHKQVNPGCDFLLVDSASPAFWCADGSPAVGAAMPDVPVMSFPDNIGHLARGGRDGWGRAFCHGLQAAIDGGYDYVAHIEGDSLFKRPIGAVVAQMDREQLDVASVPVSGTQRKETGWVETGLMIFRVDYLQADDFVARYDWQNRTAHPTPEKVIFGLLGRSLTMMPWPAARGDQGQITAANAHRLDWITHASPAAYTAFLAAQGIATPTPEGIVRINLGCGLNRLAGWANYDAEIDIGKPLPFASAYADAMLAEHVVEHVDLYAALAFFKECRRVLKPGGVLRIAVPSIEQVWKRGTPAYFEFAKKWAPSADVRGAMHAILYAHGHKAAWTASLLEAALFYAGFDDVASCAPGASEHEALRGVEGHGRVIGAAFNAIETIVCEAS